MTKSKPKRAKYIPGSKWRVLAGDANGRHEMENRGIFDELVVDHWLHIEQMDERHWWMRVGGVTIDVEIPASQKSPVEVMVRVDDPQSVRLDGARPTSLKGTP